MKFDSSLRGLQGPPSRLPPKSDKLDTGMVDTTVPDLFFGQSHPRCQSRLPCAWHLYEEQESARSVWRSHNDAG